MPALPPAGNVIRVALDFNNGAEDGGGIRFFVHWNGATPTAGNMASLCSFVAAQWETHMAPIVWVNIALVGVTARDLTSSTGAEGTWTGSNAGTRAGSPLPNAMCVLVNHQITRYYRGGKPRTYHPGGVAADLATNKAWTTTFQSAALSAWQSFIAGVLTNPGPPSLDQLVNVGYYAGVNPPITLPSGRVKQSSKLLATPNIDDIVNSSVNIRPGSQRRRLKISP